MTVEPALVVWSAGGLSVEALMAGAGVLQWTGVLGLVLYAALVERLSRSRENPDHHPMPSEAAHVLSMLLCHELVDLLTECCAECARPGRRVLSPCCRAP